MAREGETLVVMARNVRVKQALWEENEEGEMFEYEAQPLAWVEHLRRKGEGLVLRPPANLLTFLIMPDGRIVDGADVPDYELAEFLNRLMYE